MTGPRLSDALARGRDNNFDAVRLAAALAVVASHAFPLALGPGAAEPLEHLTGRSLGGWALLVFFFVSGLLVTRSALARRRTVGAFALARAARILPGLSVALLLVALLAVFLSDGMTTPTDAALYVLRGLSLVSIEYVLPGLFAGNPMEDVANGSLWSLVYEALAYALLVLTLVLGRAWRAGLALCGVALAAYLCAGWSDAAAYRLAVSAPLLAAFAAGAAAAILARRIVLDGPTGLALVAFALACGDTWLAFPAALAALGYATLLLACATRPLALGADLSYGIYLYGWPTAQLVLWWKGPLDPVALAAATAIAVLPVAALSWWLVERPALARLAPSGACRPSCPVTA